MSAAVTYRAAGPADIPALAALFALARDDLARRLGWPGRPEDPRRSEPDYEHVLGTGSFRLAEAEGVPIGLACAILRDDIWFLSGFWVHPEQQRAGIGGPLLRQVWAEGEARGCRTFCVWASSDPTALAAYMKLGMLPGYQIMQFAADPAALRLPTAPADAALRPAGLADLPLLGVLDAQIRATPRLEDHRWLLGRPDAACWLLERSGQPVAYTYTSGARIGPAAWIDPDDATDLLSLALLAAAAIGPRVVLAVPGPNHVALRLALDTGLRLRSHAHFLSTRPLGRPEQYLPQGPLLY